MKKTLKATVFSGGAEMLKGLVLSMFFINLFFLNSCAYEGKDLIEAAQKATQQVSMR
jgi:hypothetical protein